MTYDEYIINSKELQHYGILGMKWGVRRTPEQLGHHRLKKYTSPARERLKSFVTNYSIGLAAALIPGMSSVYMLKTAVSQSRKMRYRLDGEDYTKKEGPPEKLSDLKKKNMKFSAVEDMKACNPRFFEKKRHSK